MITSEELLADIRAFADDVADAEVVGNRLTLVRLGEIHEAHLSTGADDQLMVEYDGNRMPYVRFLRTLAQMDVFAERLASRRSSVPAFVDGKARLESASQERRSGTALELLQSECADRPPFASRVVFVTADAGHGKTALLRQYQHDTARAFLKAESPFLFWHVDLQGRQLLRLSEALMGDLGDLRMGGIWMPTIVCLLRRGLLVLGIDGFDELAAEQGSADALGALAVLVDEIENSGVIVAASRRTFFDTDDYLKRTRMLRTRITGACEFDELRLENWGREEGVSLLGGMVVETRRFPEPEVAYDGIVGALGHDTDHPMVTRPFLLAHIASALLRYEITAREFVTGMENSMEGVASVVRGFVAREVQEKWKSRETGEPYLTSDQHMRLLASVAEEMWIAGRDRLPLDTIEAIAAMWVEEWNIPPDRRRQVLSMVKMHVLLNIPSSGPADARSFDHPEFKDYFVASALATKLGEDPAHKTSETRRFLAAAHISDAVARYAAGLLPGSPHAVENLVVRLVEIVNDERRPSFIQPNVGTLLPYLLNNHSPSAPISIDAKAVYSSLVFEDTRLERVTFVNGTFVHTSFAGADWSNVHFRSCELTEAAFDVNARYERVSFVDCEFNGVRICDGDEELQRQYAPDRIAEILSNRFAITVTSGQDGARPQVVRNEERRRVAHRVLRQFRRTTCFSWGSIEKKLRSDADAVTKDVIPLMVEHCILKEIEPYAGRGQKQRRWMLSHSLEEILRADGNPDADKALAAFWTVIDGP